MGGFGRSWVRSALIAMLLFAVACTTSESDLEPCSGTAEINASLSRKCFPRRVEVELDPARPDFGRAPCLVYEVFLEGSESCSCSSPGYKLPHDVPPPVLDELFTTGQCAGDPCCSSRCFCELEQLHGAELAACQNGTESELQSTPTGWCYVDPEQGVGTAEVVASCPLSQKRLVRYLVPHSTTHFVIICDDAVL